MRLRAACPSLEGTYKGTLTTGYTVADLESACLQIRKVLELIALGSLVVNRSVDEQVRQRFQKDNEPDKILAVLRRVNPAFWPQPVRQLGYREEGGTRVFNYVEKETGFLEQERFSEVYGRCSQLLHALNPYSGPLDLDRWKPQVLDWHNQIIELLSYHHIRLVDKKRLIYGMMEAFPGSRIDVGLLEATTEGRTGRDS